MYFLIANPSAKSGNHNQNLLHKLEYELKIHAISYKTFFSHSEKDIYNFVQKVCQKYQNPTLVALGGDGTINDVINSIPDLSQVRFAFLPVGSSNDLARGLKIPDIHKDKKQTQNIKNIVNGKVRRKLDVGQVKYDDTGDRRLFAISSGIGFDAAVCEDSQHSHFKTFFNKINFGKLTYGAVALKKLATAPRTRAKIILDDKRVIKLKQLIMAAFMNTPYEGGGFKFAPDAKADSGKLNLAAMGDMNLLQILPKMPGAYFGHYYHYKGVHHAMAKKIQIVLDKPLWVHTDGEVKRKSKSITITCLPQKLNLIM